MPCNSDYMEASGQELESQRVCKLLAYLYDKTGEAIPNWVARAATDYYGNLDRLDEATKLLCECIRGLTEVEFEKFVYNVHDKDSRRLAGWFERHQEWDERRVKEEDETRRKIILKERALKKLSTEEMKALGLI